MQRQVSKDRSLDTLFFLYLGQSNAGIMVNIGEPNRERKEGDDHNSMRNIEIILWLKLCICFFLVLIAIFFGILWRTSRNIRSLFEKQREELSAKTDPDASRAIVGLYYSKENIDLLSDAFVGICNIGELGFIISIIAVLLSVISLFI